MNRLRNQDDQFTDPEILATRFKIGRSAFFEVELALSEKSDLSSLSNSSSSGTIAAALGFEASTGSGGIRAGCPEENQYIWVNKDNRLKNVIAVKAKSLLKGRRDYFLYNPISGRFNKLKNATLLEDVELLKVITNRGVISKNSVSHKIIRNTSDFKGQFLLNHVQGTEMLVAEKIVEHNVPKAKHRARYPIFQDFIKSFKRDGRGNCIEIELEEEFIYGSSESKEVMLLTHNLKSSAPDV